MQKKLVSIVICTHRHVELAKNAVQSLIDQSASSDCYEVIVVDNDPIPNEGFKQIVDEASKQISIRYLHEKQSGLSYARNTGGKAAQAGYIGYIDDDAKANPKYIETLVRSITQIKPDLAGGPHLPFYLDPKPKWFQDRYGSDSKGDSSRFLSSREPLIGLNMVFRRELLEELGWFDTHLSQVGYKRLGGEDTMMQINAWKAYPGLKVYYDPGLLVHHLVPARKMSLFNHIQMYYDMGLSQVYFWMPPDQKPKACRQAPLALVRLMAALIIKTLPKIFFRNRQQYPYWENYVYEEYSKNFIVLGGQVRLIADLLRHIFTLISFYKK